MSLQGEEPRHTLERGQRTHSVRYLQQSSWAWEGVSWVSRNTRQWVAPAAMRSTWIPATHVSVPGQVAQVNQHQPLLRVISRTLKRLGIRQHVESGGWTCSF